MPVQPARALSDLLARAALRLYGAEHGAVDPMVRRSKHGDLQANLAMGLGKRLGRAPRKIAEELAGGVEENDLVAAIEVAGPGFLNVTLETSWLERAAGEALASPRLAVPLATTPDTVVIDYSAPNVAKEMHVGHLRSTVIGDALARLLEFRGHTVLRQNHIGDWGTPFGMLIEHLDDLERVDPEAAARQVSLGDLGAFYRTAREKFDADPAFAERSRRRVVSLQAGDAATTASWRRLVDLSRTYFEAVYARLDVTLRAEHVRGESFYDPMLAPLADELLACGRGVVSDGAVCVFPDGFTNKEGAPLPLIVRKADGGFGYAATDLAAIRHRAGVLGATRILYVVGAPQEQHLAMIFAAARALGWLAGGRPTRVEHVAFGSVLGTDKRMFRSRSGDTVRLVDLVDEATDRARAVVAEKAPDLDLAMREAVARAVGVGSIKYADLSSDRVKDYVFDLDRMVSFDGNTAGYLQYAHARIRSVFRRAGEGEAAGAIAIEDPAERALVMDALDLGPTVESVDETLEPHRLAGYLYGLAGSFTTFYERCPILKAEPRVRASRLALAELTARTLETGLGLLGIAAPARM